MKISHNCLCPPIRSAWVLSFGLTEGLGVLFAFTSVGFALSNFSPVGFALVASALTLAVAVSVHSCCLCQALIRRQTELDEVKKENDSLRTELQAKGTLLATTSHELRTPLHGIVALTDSLLERMPSGHAGCKSLGTIADCGKHMLGLLNNILDFEKVCSDMLTLESVPFSIAAEAERVCSTFSAIVENKCIKLETAVLPSSVRHLGDPLRVHQVLNNLISNAIKFTPVGGSIKIVISSDPNGAVRGEVTDTGEGISEEGQARIFQNFAQADSSVGRRHGGTGLGLAISKRLIDAMGGEIGCRSSQGVGSTFWFRIPLPVVPSEGDEERKEGESSAEGCSEDQNGITIEGKERDDESLKGKRVLVVEDKKVNQKVCLRMLKGLGCEAEVADNGQKCLDILAVDHFDAVLMDIMMPVLDGVQTARIIKGRVADHTCRPIPIIGLTAMSDLLPSQVGMDDCVSKPFNRAQLAAVLRRWTVRPSQRHAFL